MHIFSSLSRHAGASVGRGHVYNAEYISPVYLSRFLMSISPIDLGPEVTLNPSLLSTTPELQMFLFLGRNLVL